MCLDRTYRLELELLNPADRQKAALLPSVEINRCVSEPG